MMMSPAPPDRRRNVGKEAQAALPSWPNVKEGQNGANVLTAQHLLRHDQLDDFAVLRALHVFPDLGHAHARQLRVRLQSELDQAAVDRALTAATPRSGRPAAFIATPSAAFGKSFGKNFTPHNVMEVDASLRTLTGRKR